MELRGLKKDNYNICNDNGMTDLEELFRKHYVSMVFYALRIVSDKALAEDMVQDLFSRLVMRRDKLRLDRNAKYFLFTSLRNAIIDYKRKFSYISDEPIADSPDDFSLEDSIFEMELYEQLYEAIKTLPEKCRRVMEMRLEGNDEHDIAMELGISYETVRAHVKHAKEKLRAKLKNSVAMTLLIMSL